MAPSKVAATNSAVIRAAIGMMCLLRKRHCGNLP